MESTESETDCSRVSCSIHDCSAARAKAALLPPAFQCVSPILMQMAKLEKDLAVQLAAKKAVEAEIKSINEKLAMFSYVWSKTAGKTVEELEEEMNEAFQEDFYRE